MTRFALTLEFDGTPFCGMQRQTQGPSVQQAVEDAVRATTGEAVTLHAAGRTDAGVHALGMRAHMDIAKPIAPFRLMEAINHHLRPQPIAVLACQAVAETWHARFSCIGRTYWYRIANRRAPLTLDRNRAWLVPQPLDAAAMHRAAQALVGRHDFTTFRSAHCQSASPVKTLDLLSAERVGDEVHIRAAARSFLHHQVRSMVGCLALVGMGRWREQQVAAALAARDRSALGLNAPSAGLYFVAALYPPEIEGQSLNYGARAGWTGWPKPLDCNLQRRARRTGFGRTPMTFTGRQLTTQLDADGALTVQLGDKTWDAPKGTQVLVKVEASPINPSDLGLLFASADTDNAQYAPGKIVARMPDNATRAMKARHGLAMPAGNECAGIVVAAGEDPAAQALIGKRYACVPGSAYATYAYADATMGFAVDDSISAEQAASSFVNPMTALGFTETMKLEGFTGIVHAAAASNLGQMLVKICLEEKIPLINIVRSQDQVQLLKGLGATHVLNMADADFMPRLIDAIAETRAMLGFDPIGGGTLAGQILTAMEAAASRGAAFSRYGSSEPKKVYIYGALDIGPTILNRAFGLTWDLAGWLLTPFMAKAGMEVVGRMRARVMRDLTTTFASHYARKGTLDDMLTREAVAMYNARRTGEKYLVTP